MWKGPQVVSFSPTSSASTSSRKMGALIRNLEGEIGDLRARLEAKADMHSRTNVHETYKVKAFEMAAKLATMDGTDDGMYNGLPIEVWLDEFGRSHPFRFHSTG